MASKKGIGSFLKGLFGIADDAPTVSPDKIKKIDDFTKGYDETTPPGQFKKQGDVLDDEGNVVAKEYSYTPESFTETQRRQGVGEFSDEALTEKYFNEGFDNEFGLEEFIIKQRGITQEARAAELRDKGKIKSLERSDDDPDLMVKGKIEPETIAFITNIAKSTGRSAEDVRQAIVDKMNDGYGMNDPKRVMLDDDARISAYIDTQVTMNEMDFAQELIDDVLENYPIQGMTGNPVLDDLLKQEKELIEKGKQRTAELQELRSRTQEVKEMVEGMGLDTSGIDFDLIKNSDDMNAVREEAEKLRLLMGDLMGGGIEDLAKSDNLQKALESISGQAKSDMALAKEMAEIARTPGERDTAIKKMEEIQKAYEESVKTGVYESPFSPKRVLNAKGGRIGFADGDFVAPEDIITRPADNENRIAEYMAKIESGELIYDPETKQFIPAPMKRKRQNTRPADNEEYMSDLMYRMKMEAEGRKDGGRIGLKDGGGPKFSRRGFLQGLGALAASAFLPFRGAEKVVPAVTKAKAITPVAGMPDWFPLLVNRIRSKGKVTREPGYKEFTSGGDTEKIYKLEDYTLYEDMATGKITVSGRGNDYQQVSMEYTPGENKVMSKKNPLTGEMDRGVVTEKPRFEAGEYAKGDPYDFENTGVDYDDLKGDVSNWEKFATGGRKIDDKKSVIDDFIKNQTDPNIIDDMAKGGRVGMAQGGIASRFKERVHYGN